MSADEADEEPARSWYSYENGQTIGQTGPENGFILRDEERGDADDPEDVDARVTLEQGRADNPGYFLTATLYGWLFHTRRATGEPQAQADFAAMKADLQQLADLLPYEDDRNQAEKARQLAEATADFERRWA